MAPDRSWRGSFVVLPSSLVAHPRLCLQSSSSVGKSSVTSVASPFLWYTHVVVVVVVVSFILAEKVSSLGKNWHRFCLKCERCNKTLCAGGHAEVRRDRDVQPVSPDAIGLRFTASLLNYIHISNCIPKLYCWMMTVYNVDCN